MVGISVSDTKSDVAVISRDVAMPASVDGVAANMLETSPWDVKLGPTLNLVASDSVVVDKGSLVAVLVPEGSGMVLGSVDSAEVSPVFDEIEEDSA